MGLPGGLEIIYSVFFPPTDGLKKIIEDNERENGPLVPINSGSGLRGDKWCEKHLIFDDTGDNISSLNPFFNEYTAIYWYFKNRMGGNNDYVGFYHYRRLFNEDQILDYRDYDMILPTSNDLGVPLLQQYGYWHSVSDLHTLLGYLHKTNPELAKKFMAFLLISTVCVGEGFIFIMRKELFREWCSIAFKIMFGIFGDVCASEEFEKRKDYNKRALCFLMERFFGFWVLEKISSGGCKWKPLEKVFHLDFKPEYKRIEDGID
jgi:hypothetical protein